MCPNAYERRCEPAPRRALSPYLPFNPAGARAKRTGPAATTTGAAANAALCPTRHAPTPATAPAAQAPGRNDWGGNRRAIESS